MSGGPVMDQSDSRVRFYWSSSLTLVPIRACLKFTSHARQDSDRSGDVGVFNGRHRGLPGLFHGRTGGPSQRGGEGETLLTIGVYRHVA